MVVFTCNHCGDSLQKPRVEKHYYTVCRRPKFVSCVDCLKDFRDEEYVAHTQCVTEAERYAAKGTFPGGIQKKGAVKQESWIELVKSAVNNATFQRNQQQIVTVILGSVNVPRKKAKFTNFIKSAVGNRTNVGDIEKVWDAIEKYKESQKKSNGTVEDTNENDTKTQESKIKPDKASAGCETENIENGESTTMNKNDDAFTKFVKTLLKRENISNLSDQSIIKNILSLKIVPLKKKKLQKKLNKESNGDITADLDLVWNLIEKKQSEETSVESNGSMETAIAEDPKEAISWQNKLKQLPFSEPKKNLINEAFSKLTPLPTKKNKFIKLINKSIPDLNEEDIESVWNVMQENDPSITNNSKKRKHDQTENDEISKKNKLSDSNVGQKEELLLENNENMETTTEDVEKSITWQDKLNKLSGSEPNKNLIIETALKCTNLPARKKKFIKLIKKSIPDVKREDVESVWNSIQEEDKILVSCNDSKKRKNDETENIETISKKSKLEPSHKLNNGSIVNESATNGHTNGLEDKDVQDSSQMFDKTFFKEKILEIITKHKNMTLGNLEKKVFSKYRKCVGEPTPKVIAKYTKQLNKIDSIEIADSVVNLKL